MSYSPFPNVFRIGSIFLIISAPVFWWISLGQRSDTQFWNIGSYAITSVSARDDEWESENDYKSRDSEREDSREYVIREKVEPVAATPLVVAVQQNIPTTPPASTPEPCVVQTTVAPISLENKIVQTLWWLGFGAQERQSITDQFQWLYRDISLKYPTSSWRTEVLQKLMSQADMKIAELQSFSEKNTSDIFVAKIQSLKALKALSTLQIEAFQPTPIVVTSVPCTPTSSQIPSTLSIPAAVVRKTTNIIPTKTNPVVKKPTPVPVKVVIPAPVKATPVPVAAKPAPVVSTKTAAS